MAKIKFDSKGAKVKSLAKKLVERLSTNQFKDFLERNAPKKYIPAIYPYEKEYWK
jgi:hypothetical protein